MSFSSPLAWYWVIAPLIVAMLAAGLLLRAFFHLARGRVAHGSLHAAGGAVLALTALCAGLIVLNTQSLVRLTAERPVADVIVGIDPASGFYRVTVRRLDGDNSATSCTLQGDEWLLSARVQKWKPWANILGLDSTYVLDQIANKYFTAARGNGKTITACDLAGPTTGSGALSGLSVWLMDRSYAEQRRFGSAVYMPLADGAFYRVVMTQSGLNAEATNPIAQAAVARGI